jgi:D-glycero-D-manno-heptose 1,7-bisphosphate phosphatase
MRAPSPPHPAVFLDRDGTINEDVDFLIHPDQLRLIAGVPTALRRLNQAGWPVVVITNQSAVARGMASEGDLAKIHDGLRTMLSAQGIHLDGIYYCPHHPEIGEAPYRRICDCRKPLPGLLQQAARELNLDLAASVMIGDGLRDLGGGGGQDGQAFQAGAHRG